MFLKGLSLTFLFFLHFVEGTKGPQYVVEVFFAWEPQLVQNYVTLGYSKKTAELTVKQHIEFSINEVNDYFETLSSFGINIEVRSIHLHQITQELHKRKNLNLDRSLNSSVALADFHSWLEKENIYKIYNYDAAILYTGYQLRSLYISGNTTIIIDVKDAFRAPQLCNKYAYGVATFEGLHDTITTTVVGISKIFGIQDDDDDDDQNECAGVVQPWITYPAKWHFSNCSARQLKKTIEYLDVTGNNCLNENNTATVSSNFDLSRLVGSDFLDIDKFCQRGEKTKNAFFLGSPAFYQNKFPKGDLLCQSINCMNTDKKYYQMYNPPNRLGCDKGKRCLRGKCLPAPASMPTPSLNCFLPDSRVRVFEMPANSSCDTYTGTLEACRDDMTRFQCCNACEAKLVNPTACPNGDSSSWCDQFKLNSTAICHDPQHRQTCCDTCRFYFPNITVPASSL